MTARVIPLRPPEAAEPASNLSFDDLFENYASYVGAIALRLLGRDHEVEDVVQDVFVDAFRGRHTLYDPSGVKAWLATITVHVASKRLRRRRLRRFLGLDRPPETSSSSPEHSALVKEIFAILDELPTADRVAWSLRYLEGERLDEVARLSGCSLATAKRRIASAQAIIEEGLDHG